MSTRFAMGKAAASVQPAGTNTRSQKFSLLSQWISLNLVPVRGEATLFSKPAAHLAALLSLEGAAWDGYGLSNGHLPRLAETSIPLHNHKRAIKIAVTTYYWLGLTPSERRPRACPAGRCQPRRSRSCGLCGLRRLLPGYSHTHSCQEHVLHPALQLMPLPASHSSPWN